MSAPVDVSGGVGGVEARCEDLLELARVLRHVAGRLVEVSAQVDLAGAALADPVAAVLDPVGAGTAAARVLAAAHGPHGAATLAVTAGALGAGVGSAAVAYATVEEATRSRFAGAVVGVVRAPVALGAGVLTTGLTLDVVAGVQAAVSVDPHLVDLVGIAAAGGRPAQLALLVAPHFPDGRAVLTRSAGHVGRDATGPPRDVAGLVRSLSVRNDDEPGAIDVRILTTTDPDGTVHQRAIVDIPGTKDWSLAAQNPEVTGVGTNLRALSGAATTYADGVLAALTEAGVPPGTEVLFVGHSLGGMVALAAAGRATAAGYRPAGVVTAGSPLGAIAPPPGVPVLAMENARDPVPHLDGSTNPAGAEVTTVTVDHPSMSVGANHGLDTAYLPGAADVDASTDPSVVAARARLAPFFTADAAETHVFVVRRELP